MSRKKLRLHDMKKSFMVEFELPDELTEEFMALIPEQRETINRLIAEGALKSYALAMDRSVLWVVVEADSEFEVMEIIAQMPLSDFMQPYVSELMFHNGAEAAAPFSLN
jgi:muconolactone delta-isomerase